MGKRSAKQNGKPIGNVADTECIMYLCIAVVSMCLCVMCLHQTQIGYTISMHTEHTDPNLNTSNMCIKHKIK